MKHSKNKTVQCPQIVFSEAHGHCQKKRKGSFYEAIDNVTMECAQNC